MKKRFNDNDMIHPKRRPLDAQLVLTEGQLRTAMGGDEDVTADMNIPEKKQRNPG